MIQVYNKYLLFKLLTLNNFNNIMEIFKLKKIILNFGIKNIAINSKKIIPAFLALYLISGKKASLRYSKKPIIILKIRQGMVVGCKTTLRNKDLNLFILLLLENIFSNVKDIRGLSLNSTDLGSVTFSIDDLFIFKKIDFFFELFNDLPRLNVTLLTTSSEKSNTFNFCKMLGYPMK